MDIQGTSKQMSAARHSGLETYLICPDAFEADTACEVLIRDKRIDTLVTSEEANQILKCNPNRRALLIIEDCASFLARRISRNTVPTSASEAWLAAIRPVMLLLRQNRRQIVVHRFDMIQRYAETFGQQLGLAPETTRRLKDLNLDTPDPMRALIAKVTVLLTPELHEINDELEASTFDLSNGFANSLPDLDGASVWLEQVESEVNTLRTTQAHLKMQLQLLNEQVENHGNFLIDAEAEKKMRMRMMHQVQRELERCHGELREVISKLAEERRKTTEFYDKAIEYMAAHKNVLAEKDRVTALLNAITTSRSYRLTAPLRRIRSVVRRQN